MILPFNPFLESAVISQPDDKWQLGAACYRTITIFGRSTQLQIIKRVRYPLRVPASQMIRFVVLYKGQTIADSSSVIQLLLPCSVVSSIFKMLILIHTKWNGKSSIPNLKTYRHKNPPCTISIWSLVRCGSYTYQSSESCKNPYSAYNFQIFSDD